MKTKKTIESPEINKLKEEINVLNSNVKMLKELAEKAGTEKNVIKRQLIILEEKYRAIEEENRILKQVKKK